MIFQNSLVSLCEQAKGRSGIVQIKIVMEGTVSPFLQPSHYSASPSGSAVLRPIKCPKMSDTDTSRNSEQKDNTPEGLGKSGGQY